MPSRCVLGGCSNTNENGFMLHQWPKDPKLARNWTRFVRNTRVWIGPTKSSVLCSEHFAEHCYETTEMARNCGYPPRLKVGTIPTIKQKKQPSLQTKNFDEQMFESLLVEGKRKRTLKAPTVFFHIKSRKTRKSLKKKSANTNITTTQKFVKNKAILPKQSYSAAPPADSSSPEDRFSVPPLRSAFQVSCAGVHEPSELLSAADRVKNCDDKMEGFEILQIKVEDLQTDGFEELAREPAGADHVKDRGDEMEKFGIFPIKVEDLQSDVPEDVGREETQMMVSDGNRAQWKQAAVHSKYTAPMPNK
uniref:THAP-type domain-containing protein n=1 Tax=Eptatretus burgeri TaxID=7764 RepID=A0A8C4QML7_EPTBU